MNILSQKIFTSLNCIAVPSWKGNSNFNTRILKWKSFYKSNIWKLWVFKLKKDVAICKNKLISFLILHTYMDRKSWNLYNQIAKNMFSFSFILRWRSILWFFIIFCQYIFRCWLRKEKTYYATFLFTFLMNLF